MSKKVSLGKIIFFLTLIAVVSSCKNTNKENEETAVEETLKESESPDSSAQKIVYSLPSPLRVVTLLKRAGGHYIEGLLNPADNAKKYSTSFSRALNIGVYGADLAYATIHNQTQASINCLKADRVLADGLGLSTVFTSFNILPRFENNLSNKDSLLGLISDLYRESDNFLKENDNQPVAALILSGGWLEGLYIATKSYDKEKGTELLSRIAEQKLSLDNLVKILEDHKDKEEFKGLLNSLVELQKVFEVGDTYVEKEATKDEKTNVISLNSEATFTLNDASLKAISEKVSALRASVIKPN